MPLKARLARLEQQRPGDGPCPGPITAIVPHDGRGPLPPDAPPCPRCGVPHVLAVEEIVIEAGAPLQ